MYTAKRKKMKQFRRWLHYFPSKTPSRPLATKTFSAFKFTASTHVSSTTTARKRTCDGHYKSSACALLPRPAIVPRKYFKRFYFSSKHDELIVFTQRGCMKKKKCYIYALYIKRRLRCYFVAVNKKTILKTYSP